MSVLSAVIYREMKIRITNSTFIFWDLFYPLGYLLVFGVGINSSLGTSFQMGEVRYHDFFLAGVLGMASFGIASNTAWSFFMDRDNGIFYEMLAYPMSRARYLGSKALFNVFVALLQAFVTVGLAACLLDVPVRLDLLPLLVAGVALGSAGWFFFYAVFALKIRRNDLFNTVTSIFYFAFLFASSMFYPLEPLPAWFQSVAMVNPITWHVDILRYATIGSGNPAVLAVEAVAFLGFLTVSFVWAVRALRQEG